MNPSNCCQSLYVERELPFERFLKTHKINIKKKKKYVKIKLNNDSNKYTTKKQQNYISNIYHALIKEQTNKNK